jgi:CubicO group peptidase (beta-lactamase class C family)
MRIAKRILVFFIVPLSFVVGPVLRTEAARQASVSAVQQPPAAIPSTPAGRQFSEWLAAFNSGDANEIRSFIEQHFAESALKRIQANERARMDAIIYNSTRGLIPHRVAWSTDPEITVIAQAKLTEDWVRIDVQVGSDSAHQISRFSLAPVPPPAELGSQKKMTDAQILERLQTYLDKLVAADAFSGAVIVAKQGKPLFQRVYGLANKNSKIPNRLDTKFNLGSLNTMFTGVGVAQLAEQGKLSFDDKIMKHLPNYPNQDVAEKVTIAQLLTHTSGMGDYFNPKFDTLKANLRFVRDYFPLFVNDPLSFPPGEKSRYSNAGFIVLGAIIERVSGQSYFDYLQEHIYKLASMSNTDFYEMDRTTPNLAIGYTNRTSNGRLELLSQIENSAMLPVRGGPAGGGFSTVTDLLNFDIALRTHKLLSPRFTDIVLTGTAKGDDSGLKYAYGFADEMVYGTRIVGDAGGFPGANAQLDMYLDLGYTVAILSNYDPPGAQRVAVKLREMIASSR